MGQPRSAQQQQNEMHHHHHVLTIPYPSQGHINPLLQLCKRLAFTKGNLKATLALSNFVYNSLVSNQAGAESGIGPVQFDTISDGYDQGGFAEASSIPDYLARFELVGSRTLAELIERHSLTDHPITCIVYDAFMPWVLDVAKKHGVAAAVFFTQPCTVNYIYYCLKKGVVSVEDVSSGVAEIPGLTPAMRVEEMPGYLGSPGSYPAYFQMVLDQYVNVDEADCILVNSFYELESKMVDLMSKVVGPTLLPVGPTIPSFYLDDNRIKDDKTYGLSLFTVQEDDSKPNAVAEWLKIKPPGSVVYIAFGSMASIEEDQMEEISWAIRELSSSAAYTYNFLLAIKATEVSKLPKDFVDEINNDNDESRCLIVNWCTQIEVLASEAVGCFVSHCGWNSTLEALCLGVPMVAMPIWTDQPTNAKLIQDEWKVGLRAKADSKGGIVRRGELKACLREMMEAERGKQIRASAQIWRDSAKKAVSLGGSSDANIDAFLSKVSEVRSLY